MEQHAAKVGGLTEQHDADAKVQELCDKVKKNAEEEAGKNFDEFKAIAYKTQVVAGTNYFVKVKVGNGDGDFIILRIYQALDGEVSLNSIKTTDVTKDSPIEYFQN